MQCRIELIEIFCEDAPEYHVMAAGSLLGVALASGDGFPVGKTDFLQMYPVTFKEFLNAADKTLHDFIDGITSLEPLPEFALARLEEHFRRYQVCGGMPAAMANMLSGKNIEEIEQILKSILTAYALDFSKHAPGREIPRITAVWDSIPSQLARENRKFLYKNVKPGARAREYEDALLWLKQAGLTHQVFCASRPGLPISAYDDLSAFKIYMFDTALLRVKAGLSHEVLLSDNPLFREFKGAMAENQILQSLVTQFDTLPRYWVSSGTAEVDFLLQTATDVIPIEVKAATNTSGKSLKVYCDKFSPRQSGNLFPQQPEKRADTATHTDIHCRLDCPLAYIMTVNISDLKPHTQSFQRGDVAPCGGLEDGEAEKVYHGIYVVEDVRLDALIHFPCRRAGEK